MITGELFNVFRMMETCDPSGNAFATEDSSDRSESSHFDQQRIYQDYENPKALTGLNLSVDRKKNDCQKSKQDSRFFNDVSRHHTGVFDDFGVREATVVSLTKTKNLNFATDITGYQLERSSEGSESAEPKETLYNFGRNKKHRILQDYGITKNYNLMKEFNLPLDHTRDNHIGSLTLDRLPAVGLLNNSRLLETNDFRSPQNLESMTFDGMRRTHLLNQIDLSVQNLTTQFPSRHSVGHINPSHQQHHQQQTTSFTIDAILGKNNQREKHQRSQQQPYRKTARQEGKFIKYNNVITRNLISHRDYYNIIQVRI